MDILGYLSELWTFNDLIYKYIIACSKCCLYCGDDHLNGCTANEKICTRKERQHPWNNLSAGHHHCPSFIKRPSIYSTRNNLSTSLFLIDLKRRVAHRIKAAQPHAPDLRLRHQNMIIGP